MTEMVLMTASRVSRDLIIVWLSSSWTLLKKAHLSRQQGQSLKVWDFTTTHPPSHLKAGATALSGEESFSCKLQFLWNPEESFKYSSLRALHPSRHFWGWLHTVFEESTAPESWRDRMANSSNQLIQYSIYFWANCLFLLRINNHRYNHEDFESCISSFF